MSQEATTAESSHFRDGAIDLIAGSLGISLIFNVEKLILNLIILCRWYFVGLRWTTFRYDKSKNANLSNFIYRNGKLF